MSVVKEKSNYTLCRRKSSCNLQLRISIVGMRSYDCAISSYDGFGDAVKRYIHLFYSETPTRALQTPAATVSKYNLCKKFGKQHCSFAHDKV
jgi:hypothetical protein